MSRAIVSPACIVSVLCDMLTPVHPSLSVAGGVKDRDEQQLREVLLCISQARAYRIEHARANGNQRFKALPDNMA